MRIVVPAETRPGERRVALTPDAVAPLVDSGHTVVVESGAGTWALAKDADYEAAGAEVQVGDVLTDAELVLHVRPLLPEQVQRLREGTATAGFVTGAGELPGIRALRDGRISALAMELIPRISRAQSMDALTSQALVAGYRCALEAATRLPRFFPLFMTAAGTVRPAKVLVLGAGVAGLQAIATAKRLGAVVEAYDVRPASADEVRSMGAAFLDLGLDAQEGSGGYAREMAADRARRQQEALAPHLAKADVVITTAAVPGRPAPLLVTADMLAGMPAGSVVVDLAAESGGNVEGSVAGQTTAVGDVQLVGMADAPSTLPVDASRLYAKNITSLLALGLSEDGFRLDLEDEIFDAACLAHDGVVRHAPTAKLLEEEQ
ncbi:MAG TPA: NAD(P) transhydrogenase subunit alpha [Segeticoccus sp.]|uniref:NAD(P) transhydrogenase subunit alpha n=1 Tax=Segeticoccus sp. TaxID=2706531 RepID=UPI002D7ED668|nr:NAD(P) transhydrogenase subunit alpha [Segeticoccus sp.]HET8599279.1 NAD(P) transhydrogenase subunit alpha [Segeticoccus sp.]